MKREELINRIKARTYEPNDKLTLEIAYSDLWILIADELQAKKLSDLEIERWAYDVSKQNICGDYEKGIAKGKELGAKWYRDR